tara:strand:- start:2664 stop:2843 length:180 start_codon:yes stop_codon:yes gene_type:complete
VKEFSMDSVSTLLFIIAMIGIVIATVGAIRAIRADRNAWQFITERARNNPAAESLDDPY